ncbi:hypothetical protein EJ08DRAFT_309984 [Tothia fuscella]|uniref:Uncharacterized protein n=1 Tax=Tothia fuscella TaxID=1048955 RepID=A0A9P4NP97_9PEZI|nr:hypothetical protein EJ08DRAFT_309984 [Tothia fuscella]
MSQAQQPQTPPRNPPDLRTLQQVEAYLTWNLDGTNKLIDRLQERIADIEEKLRYGNLESAEKKRVRRARSKTIHKLKNCQKEVHMLQDSLVEIDGKVATQKQLMGIHNTLMTLATPLGASPFSPWLPTHVAALSSNSFGVQNLQSLHWRSSLTPYAYSAYPFTPFPYTPTPYCYAQTPYLPVMHSPYPFQSPYIFSPVPYGVNTAPAFSVPVPFDPSSITLHPTIKGPALAYRVFNVEHSNFVPNKTFRLSDPPKKANNVVTFDASSKSSPQRSDSPPASPSQKSFSNELSPTISEPPSRRYSAAAVDLLVCRLKKTSICGHLRNSSDLGVSKKTKSLAPSSRRYHVAPV